MLNVDWGKKSHKGLRKLILYLVRDSPRTGAEIMDALEGMSQGWWRPSPGSVYPMLDGLVQEGVLVRQEGKKYSLTERGRNEIEHPLGWLGKDTRPPPRSVEEVLDQMSGYVSYLEDLAAGKSEKLAENSARIRELRERISRLEAP